MDAFSFQLIERTQRHVPRNLAGVGIYCNQVTPGRLLARHTVCRIPELNAHVPAKAAHPTEAAHVTRRANSRDLKVRPVMFYDNFENRAQVLGVGKDVAQLGIERDAAPISASEHTREVQAELEAVWRIRTAIPHTAFLRDEGLAELLLLWRYLRDIGRRKTIACNRRGLNREGLGG